MTTSASCTKAGFRSVQVDVRGSSENDKEVCLGMKKRSLGEGNWNGCGGKVELKESIIEGAKREAQEEFSVTPISLRAVGIQDFIYTNKPEWNNRCSVFICDQWEGEAKESEEMRPKWFPLRNLPYNSMWEDDKFWLPKVLCNQVDSVYYKIVCSVDPETKKSTMTSWIEVDKASMIIQ